MNSLKVTSSSISSSAKGNLEMIIAMMLSGTIGYFVIHSEQSFWNVVFFRCLIGGACLLLFALYKGRLPKALFNKSVVALIVLGGIALVANWVFLFASFHYIPFSIATVAYHTQPLMLVFVGALLARQAPSANILFWLMISFAGLMLVIELDTAEIVSLFSPNSESSGSAEISDALFGLLLALAAAFLYTVTTLITKKVQDIPSYLVALIQVGIGVIMLLPFVEWNALPTTLSSWSDLFILGAITTCFMYIIMYDAFQRLPTSLIAILSFIYPVTALVVDHWAFGTHISTMQILGVMFILLSVCAVKFGWSFDGLIGKRRSIEKS